MKTISGSGLTQQSGSHDLSRRTFLQRVAAMGGGGAVAALIGGDAFAQVATPESASPEASSGSSPNARRYGFCSYEILTM